MRTIRLGGRRKDRKKLKVSPMQSLHKTDFDRDGTFRCTCGWSFRAPRGGIKAGYEAAWQHTHAFIRRGIVKYMADAVPVEREEMALA